MFWESLKSLFEKNKYIDNHTSDMFKALVYAAIPSTNDNGSNQPSVKELGALDLYVDEYHIWSLDHSLSINIFGINLKINLSRPTAKMLDIASKELVYRGENKEPVNQLAKKSILPYFAIKRLTLKNLNNNCQRSTVNCQLFRNIKFASLAPSDRFRAITLLEQNRINLKKLPLPYWNNPDFVFATLHALPGFSTRGYYSEWPAYGATRLETPEEHVLEHTPLAWKQIEYPGPSKGYHGFRGYLE